MITTEVPTYMIYFSAREIHRTNLQRPRDENKI